MNRVMRVKTRIFVWIAGLFILTWVVFFIFARYEMKTDLYQVKKRIRERVEEIDEQRQNQIEQYLKIAFGEALAETITLLNEITTHEWILDRFDPSVTNADTNTWLSAALLLTAAERIDFIQCINDGKVTSLIVSTPPYVTRMAKIALPNHLHLIVQELSDGHVTASIGIPYWVVGGVHTSLKLSDMKYPWPENNDFWLLFSVDAILNGNYEALLAKQITLSPEDAGVQLLVGDPLFFKKAITDVLELVISTQKMVREDHKLVSLLQSPTFDDFLKQEISKIVIIEKEPNIGPIVSDSQKMFVMEMKNQVEAKYLIWALATLVGSGVWDFDPHAHTAPQGILRCHHLDTDQSQIGVGILAKDVFMTKPYQISHACDPSAVPGENICVDDVPSIIESDVFGSNIFVGNTMNMIRKEGNKNRYGSLTVAVNGDNILKRAAITLQESVFLIAGQEVLKAYGTEGQPIPRDLWQRIDIEEITKQDRGVVSDGDGNEYFFTRINPTGNSRYVFVFRLQESEFFTSAMINARTQVFLNKISAELAILAFLLLVIVIIILDRILTRLTKPIVQLSKATEQICEGHLSKVYLPNLDTHSKDEVGKLYHSFGQMVDSMIEGEKAKGLLSKVVSSKIAHKIMTTGVQLGGEKREVTILFSDIRGFTSLSEQVDPEELLNLLNGYLTRMTDFIELYDGVVDKYVGDEIMALFGAPVDIENGPGKAILCAIDMIEDLKKWNEERKAQGLRVLEVGTGINTGVVFAGNVGGGDRANYTVIGQVVNVAERLCSAAKGMEIIVCKTTFEKMEGKDEVLFEEQAPLELKGVSRVVPNYRIFGRSKPSKSQPLY